MFSPLFYRSHKNAVDQAIPPCFRKSSTIGQLHALAAMTENEEQYILSNII